MIAGGLSGLEDYVLVLSHEVFDGWGILFFAFGVLLMVIPLKCGNDWEKTVCVSLLVNIIFYGSREYALAARQ